MSAIGIPLIEPRKNLRTQKIQGFSVLLFFTGCYFFYGGRSTPSWSLAQAIDSNPLSILVGITMLLSGILFLVMLVVNGMFKRRGQILLGEDGLLIEDVESSFIQYAEVKGITFYLYNGNGGEDIYSFDIFYSKPQFLTYYGHFTTTKLKDIKAYLLTKGISVTCEQID